MMRIALLETITTPGGHEVDFDRLLDEEWTEQGHEVNWFVPEDVNPVTKSQIFHLSGKSVSYAGKKGFAKWRTSFLREWRRRGWFNAAAKLARQQDVDAIVIPTSTYRYLRALRHSSLIQAGKPIIFILHGLNPGEAPKFFSELGKLPQQAMVETVVITFGDTVLGKTHPRMKAFSPPAYEPRDVAGRKAPLLRERVLRLGFFGQYRREKQLERFLDVFLSCNFSQPCELVVQGATMRLEDTEDFKRIQEKYKEHKQLSFIHKGLFGAEWQEAILQVDALLLPYGAPRYRYHWAGMLFTAIGHQRPVLASDEINPEVWEKYDLGMTFEATSEEALRNTLERFINTFAAKKEWYEAELARAAEEYSPSKFAERLVLLCEACNQKKSL